MAVRCGRRALIRSRIKRGLLFFSFFFFNLPHLHPPQPNPLFFLLLRTSQQLTGVQFQRPLSVCPNINRRIERLFQVDVLEAIGLFWFRLKCVFGQPIVNPSVILPVPAALCLPMILRPILKDTLKNVESSCSLKKNLLLKYATSPRATESIQNSVAGFAKSDVFFK